MMRPFLLSLCLSLPLPAAAETLTVFAAASLNTALERIATLYEEHSETEISLVFAGSSALARQIEAGAPADVFISANEEWMDTLSDRLVPGSRRDLLGNRLVLVGIEGPELDLGPAVTERLGEGRLAIALTDAVPAGIYGRAALGSLGLWDALESRLAQADNTRAALALVATGAAEMGIVYATDAVAEPRVQVLAQFDPSLHPPIRYPAAAIDGGNPAAVDFLKFLEETEASTVFAQEGFEVLD